MGKRTKSKAAEKKTPMDSTPSLLEERAYRIPIGQIGTSERCASCSKKDECPSVYLETLTKKDVSRMIPSSGSKAKGQASGKSGSERAKSKVRTQKWGCEAPIAKLGSVKRTVLDSITGNREEVEILIRSDLALERKVGKFISLLYKGSKFPPYVILICLDLYITKKISPDRIVRLLSMNDLQKRMPGRNTWTGSEFRKHTVNVDKE